MTKGAHKKPIGRPSKYTPELAEEICARLSEGEPLAVICRDEHMPERSAIYEWMRKDEELSARIAYARALGYDALADECLKIADNSEADDIPEAVQRAKLRIETRLKLLAKWDPKRYGDRQQHEVTGQVQHTIRPELPWESLSPETRALVMAELEAERARLAAPVDIEVEDDD